MPTTDDSRRPWSACPNCNTDLREGVKTRPPYDKCPACGTAIEPIWWQRLLWVLLGLLLSFALPAWLGMGSLLLIFGALICEFPAHVIAYILVFKTIPPKYVRHEEAFTTLFQEK